MHVAYVRRLCAHLIMELEAKFRKRVAFLSVWLSWKPKQRGTLVQYQKMANYDPNENTHQPKLRSVTAVLMSYSVLLQGRSCGSCGG
jgi:hypothetical protein